MINSYDKIVTGVYLGDESSPRAILQKKEHITHVISLIPTTKTIRKLLLKKSIVHMEHLIPNDINEDIIKHFDELYPTIKDILNKKDSNNSILIHCELGRSRSAAIVLLLLMKKYRYNYKTGYELMKLKRDVELNYKFEEAIQNYKKMSRREKNKKIK